MFISPVNKDGFCILAAVAESLKRAGVQTSTLKDVVRGQFQKDKTFCQGFSTNEVDVQSELELFIQNPGKNYPKETVDLFMDALAIGVRFKFKD